MNIAELAKKLTFTHGKITFTGEDAMQACLQEWMRVKSHEYPELAFFYHVPNLNKAGRWEGIKRMLLGVKAGVWDNGKRVRWLDEGKNAKNEGKNDKDE